MNNNNNKLKNILNGAILKNNKINIPYDIYEGEIPKKSMIYKNKISIKFKELKDYNINKVKK